jgi:hypothetical protein
MVRNAFNSGIVSFAMSDWEMVSRTTYYVLALIQPKIRSASDLTLMTRSASSSSAAMAPE